MGWAPMTTPAVGTELQACGWARPWEWRGVGVMAMTLIPHPPTPPLSSTAPGT